MSQVLYYITEKSGNRKTGPIPVTTSSYNSCPDTCPFKGNGCYADGGPLRLHWEKTSNGERGYDFEEFLNKLNSLKEKRTERIRLWQAGDMPGINRRINVKQTKRLVRALQRFKDVFGFTHKPMTKENQSIISYCNNNGVSINLSANNLKHADELADLEIGPVSVTLPHDVPTKGIVTPKGRRVIICPAVLNDNVSCAVCGGKRGSLCGRVDRDFIIGFPAHGFKKRAASEVANG